MTDAPRADDGEQLVQQLYRAATDTLGETATRTAALGGWSSAHWLVLRTLALVDTATAAQLREQLDDYERVYDSADATTAVLARHAREVNHQWPTHGGIIDTTLTMARRGGLVDVDWRGRGRNWLWSTTADGREVFSSR